MKNIIYILLIFQLNALDYSSDVSKIIYENCTNCHRDGHIASFLPLTSYNQVFENRFWIAYAIQGDIEGVRHGDPIMPPWPADRNYSTLLDEMFLTNEEIQIYLDWVDDGAMQGDPNEEYPMPNFPEGSNIGIPDLVIEMEEPYIITGNYLDDYRCFILNAGFIESQDISALEFVPGNLEAVHHALIVAVPEGSLDALDQADSGYGYECFGGFGTSNVSDFLGGYAPGTMTREWPNGLAQQIPANSDLVMQVHYAPVYSDQIDQSSINIFFKDEPVDRYVQEYILINSQLALPPNEITEVTADFEIHNDISLIQFLPHSHLLGKTWEIYATTPDVTIPLIRINNWNFDWQFWYSPEYMIHLPAGSVVHASCIYDNTIENLNNPNIPPEWVFWGDETTSEMFFIPFRYVDYKDGDENIYLGQEQIFHGDINYDNSINILDIIMLVNFILSGDCINVADINWDNECNILDVVELIDFIVSE